MLSNYQIWIRTDLNNSSILQGRSAVLTLSIGVSHMTADISIWPVALMQVYRLPTVYRIANDIISIVTITEVVYRHHEVMVACHIRSLPGSETNKKFWLQASR